MVLQRKWIITVFLVLLSIGINLFSNNQERVESLYSLLFYPAFSNCLRILFGWLPFSIGDMLYALFFLFIVWKSITFLRILFSKKGRLQLKLNATKNIPRVVNTLAIIYIIFNVFWGINYNRVGVAHQLGLKLEKYTVEDLKHINELLVQKINSSKSKILNEKKSNLTNDELFKQTNNAYKIASEKYPFLNYKNVSIKSSMWGWLGNYTGFLGYYNPFTGEAQVNTTVPKFTQPFTTCHEVAHQLGYAKEMEANFVGYLSATSSTEERFRYSVYIDLFAYSNRTLHYADSTSAFVYRKQLSFFVMKDVYERRKFNADHESFIEPIVSYFYDKFLLSNEQPMGILSYNEVTTFIIAYYKKYGDI
jgi:hypothetical protein